MPDEIKADYMTIYVDNFRVPATAGRRKSRWSHLATDSPDIEELHTFAESIGLRRSWFQEYTKVGHLYRPHYDVTDTRRAAAIRGGAVQVPYRGIPEILRRAREAASP